MTAHRKAAAHARQARMRTEAKDRMGRADAEARARWIAGHSCRCGARATTIVYLDGYYAMYRCSDHTSDGVQR